MSKQAAIIENKDKEISSLENTLEKTRETIYNFSALSRYTRNASVERSTDNAETTTTIRNISNVEAGTRTFFKTY